MASIRKHGNSWQARVRRQGFPVEIKTFSTRAEAERWSRLMESEMDRGQFVSRAEAEQTTFGDIIQRYIATITPTKRGRREETIRLTATLRHRITKLSMTNLMPKAMAEYRDDRLKICQPNTVVRDLAALSSIINHARRERGIAIENPIPMICKPIMPPGRDRILSSIEEVRLPTELAPMGRRNPIILSLVIVGIETANRCSEILSLKWQRIDLERRTIFLPLMAGACLARRARPFVSTVEVSPLVLQAQQLQQGIKRRLILSCRRQGG